MHFLLLTKWSHESTNIDTFKCSDENLPNSSCHFPNHRPVFLQILRDSSFSLKITPLYVFLVKCYILCTKGTNYSANFGELIARIKIHQILVISETTNQFFFKFCITLSVSWDITLLYFFSWNFMYFQQKEPIKVYKNLVKFHVSSRKSEILHFDGLLL